MPSQFTMLELGDCRGRVESILSSNTCISHHNFCKTFVALSPSHYTPHNSSVGVNGTDNNICFPTSLVTLSTLPVLHQYST